MSTLARQAVRMAQRLAPSSRCGLRILCYHLVGAGTDSAVDVPLADFRRQIDSIRQASTAVTLADGLRRLAAHDTRDQAYTAVTFDDAYQNFAEVVWPVLSELRVPATMYVPTGFVDGSHRGPLSGAEALPALGWRQLDQMCATGLLELGAHTTSHPRDLRSLQGDRLDFELRNSRDRIEQEMSRPAPSFCYPRGLWDARIESAVRRHFDSAVVGGGRRVAPDADLFRLSRTSVRRDPAFAVEQWIRSSVWIEEAIADPIRRRRR